MYILDRGTSSTNGEVFAIRTTVPPTPQACCFNTGRAPKVLPPTVRPQVAMAGLVMFASLNLVPHQPPEHAASFKLCRVDSGGLHHPTAASRGWAPNVIRHAPGACCLGGSNCVVLVPTTCLAVGCGEVAGGDCTSSSVPRLARPISMAAVRLTSPISSACFQAGINQGPTRMAATKDQRCHHSAWRLGQVTLSHIVQWPEAKNSSITPAPRFRRGAFSQFRLAGGMAAPRTLVYFSFPCLREPLGQKQLLERTSDKGEVGDRVHSGPLGTGCPSRLIGAFSLVF